MRTGNRIVRLAGAASVLLGVASCAQNPMKEAHTPLTEVASRPSDYSGQQVTLEGIIRYVYAPGVFITGPEGRWPTDQQRLLVITADTKLIRPALAEGALISFRGVARVIQRESFAKDFAQNPNTGLLGEDFFDEWNGRSAVLVEDIVIRQKEDKKPVVVPATQPTTQPAV